MPFVQDFEIISHLSSDGALLGSAEDNGRLRITSVRTDTTLGFIDFGYSRRVTRLKWISSSALVVGTGSGNVIQASIVPDLASNSSNLAVFSLITRNSNNRPVTAICFDPHQYLLAIAFDGEVQVLQGHLTEEHQRQWMLYDSIKCELDWVAWEASDMSFFSRDNKSLIMAGLTGFGIWVYQDKSFWWYSRACSPAIKRCDVSPNNRTLAVSTEDYSVLIWPLSAFGPISKRQRSFTIPTGRDWAKKADAPPIAFVGNRTIATADPIGAIYLLSTDGELQQTFSVGENLFVQSIWVHKPTMQVVVMGPVFSPILVGFEIEDDVTETGTLVIRQEELSFSSWPKTQYAGEWLESTESRPARMTRCAVVLRHACRLLQFSACGIITNSSAGF